MTAPALHLHNGIRLVAGGRIVMLPMLCTRNGRVVATFPEFLNSGRTVTFEAARAYYAAGPVRP